MFSLFNRGNKRPRGDSPTNIEEVRTPEATISVDKKADMLFSATKVIPPDLIDGINEKLKVRLKTQTRPIEELVRLAQHPCVKDYLISAIKLYESQEASAKKAMQELKPEDRGEFDVLIKQQYEIFCISVANILGDGFDVALKENLIFRDGVPIGVTESNRTRMSTCHAALSTGGKKTKKKSKRKAKKTRKSKMRA